MRLYNAIATGTLQDGENVLIQIELPLLGGRRARISSWNASFNGIIAGNSLSIKLTRDSSSGTSTESDVPAVLDGTFFDAVESTEPITRWGFTALPTAGATIDGPLQASDPSYVFRQYASGREIVVGNDSRVSLRCTPSNMLAAVGYKVNVILAA